MIRTAVRSTEIAIVGYDENSKLLEVAFRNGSVYHYEGVTQKTYQEMIQAESVGSFFASHVKNSFPYKKLH